MTWPSAHNLVRLIFQNRLDEIKNLLQYDFGDNLKKKISRKIKHCSLLFVAVLYDRASIVDYLLDTCKADPNDVGLYNGALCPCLVVAAMQNNMIILTSLLKNGAGVDITNVYRRTALFMAAYNKNHFMLRYLVEKGADVNKSDYKGTTCLMVALGSNVISRFLINSGADINHVNHEGRTALMLAVENQNMRGIFLLLSCGADINLKNDYGESAAFLGIMNNRWDIVMELERSGFVAADTAEAEVCEIKSCREVIRKDPTETILLWKKAVLLRDLPVYTPLFRTDNSTVLRRDLGWIHNYFDHITGSAILFLASRWTLLNPHALTILRDAICQIENPTVFAILYRNFLKCLRAANNQLFEKAYLHINLMTFRFLLEWGNNQSVFEIFKSSVLHIENLFQRIRSSTDAESLSLELQIDSYLRLFIDILKKIISNFPNNIADVTEGIKTVVKIDDGCFSNLSLLHLCIKHEYPLSLTRVFLICGADVMRVDQLEKTAVHYMLETCVYSTKEALNMFLDYGFRPEKFRKGFCLPCALRKRRMLTNPVRYVTLTCLTAEIVGRKLPYENRLPVDYQDIIYSHF